MCTAGGGVAAKDRGKRRRTGGAFFGQRFPPTGFVPPPVAPGRRPAARTWPSPGVPGTTTTLPPLGRGQTASTLLAEPEVDVTGTIPGRPHTPESRAKISAANKGKRPWNKGIGHSEETKARIRERTKEAMEAKKREKVAAMGMTLEEFEAMKVMEAESEKARKREAKRNLTQSADYKARLSQRMKERWQNPQYREKALKHLNESRAMQTEETRAKISATMKKIWEEERYSRNRTIGEETRAKISAKLKEMYADPEYRSKLSTTRRRDPEHNKKIAEAIRKKWAENEDYKNKTLSGIHVYQAQYQEARIEDPEKFQARRRNTTAATLASARARATRAATGTRRMTAAKRKAMMREELQELERMDREMRGEIRPRKAMGNPGMGRKKSSRVSEMMAKQAKDAWDSIYGDVQAAEGREDGGARRSEAVAAAARAPARETTAVSASSALTGEDEHEDALSFAPTEMVGSAGDVSSPSSSSALGGEGEGGEEGRLEEAVPGSVVEDAESDLEWKKFMERMASNDREDEELKKQRKAAQKRFLEEEVSTEVFQLVNGKVAVLPTPPADAAAAAALDAPPLPSPATSTSDEAPAEGGGISNSLSSSSSAGGAEQVSSYPSSGFPLELEPAYPTTSPRPSSESSSSSSSSKTKEASRVEVKV